MHRVENYIPQLENSHKYMFNETLGILMNTFRFKVLTHNDTVHHRAIVSNDYVTAYYAVVGEAYPFGIKEIHVKADDVPNEYKAPMGVRETECIGCEETYFESELEQELCRGCWEGINKDYCMGELQR